MRTLCIFCPDHHFLLGPIGAELLAGLRHVASLEVLRLELKGCMIGSTGARALATLNEAPRLHTLDLDRAFNNICSKGVEALVNLKNAAALRYLGLNLQYNAFHVCSVLTVLSTLQGASSKIKVDISFLEVSAQTALECASLAGDVPEIEALLHVGWDVQAGDVEGTTGLMYASLNRHVEKDEKVDDSFCNLLTI